MNLSALSPRTIWFVLALSAFLPLTCPQHSAAQSAGSGATLSELKSLAMAGDRNTQFRLGMTYYRGTAVAKNRKEAAMWIDLAAEQGLAAAQYNLGRMFRNGAGVPRSHELAAQWYAKAAAQDYVKALNALALLYRKGEGVEADFVTARDLYTRAAELGYSRAQFNLECLITESQ